MTKKGAKYPDGLTGHPLSDALGGNPNNLTFAIKNASKDVGYYGQMADVLGLESIMSQPARQALSTAIDGGVSDNMVSEIVSFFEKKFTA